MMVIVYLGSNKNGMIMNVAERVFFQGLQQLTL